jgi:alpha-1,6-mannosyltransferase
MRLLGMLGLGGVLVSVALLATGAATSPNLYVPSRVGGWPHWLAGPFQALGVGISPNSFQSYTLILGASYLVVLFSSRALSLRALAITIVAAHILLLLGPPLISQDVFGYLGFARLGALHGLNPYAHVPAEASGDPIYPFVGWPYEHPPYGPVFTLISYVFAPLGLAGGIWALKALAAIASLAAIWLVARAAAGMGFSARFAAAFVGLNPVLLELAVGGDHNDTLVLLLVSCALALTAARPPRTAGRSALPVAPAGAAGAFGSPRPRAAAAALAAAVGLKVSAGVVVPFLVLSPAPAGAPLQRRQRIGLLLSALAALALVAAVGLVAFGSHVLAFLGAVHEEQQMVALHSIPAETARLFALHGVPGWWRALFIAAFVVTMVVALWFTARGADWRTGAGWATLALVVCTAWLLPWYAIWPLPLAALSRSRSLRAATLVFCTYALMIHLPLAEPLLAPHHPSTMRKTAEVVRVHSAPALSPPSVGARR